MFGLGNGLGKTPSSGSVFAKLEDNNKLVKEARGRILAVDMAHQSMDSIHAELAAESARVHSAADRLRAKLESVLASL